MRSPLSAKELGYLITLTAVVLCGFVAGLYLVAIALQELVG